MATIIQTLENAEYNLENGVATIIGFSQLRNAIELLDKGYSPYCDVDDLVRKYGSLKEIPEVDDENY